MTALPPSTDFTGSSVTQGQFKTAISALRTFVADLLGADSGDKAAARAALGSTTVGDAVFIATTSAAARAALSLGNVDNTSDASKPVSSAAQTALDLKAPLASPTFTGTLTHAGGNITATANVVGGKSLTFQNSDAGAGSYVANNLTSNNGSIVQQIGATAGGGTGSIYYTGTNVLNLYTTGATPLQLGTNNNTGHLVIDSTGNVTKNTATGALGYGTGAGGTVTQATSKSTAVTLNKPTGQITMNNAALASGAAAIFTLTNSLIQSTSIVTCVPSAAGSTADAYIVSIPPVSAGSARIRVTNISGGSLSEAVVLNFAIFNGATS